MPDKLAKMKDDLDTKASLHDLANLQANLMDKLNELMANLENMFADKESTRKKLAQLEKAVSYCGSLKFYLAQTAARVDSVVTESAELSSRGRRHVHQEVCGSS